MKKIILRSIILLCFVVAALHSNGQSLVEYKYWFDNDYANAITESLFPPAINVEVSNYVDTPTGIGFGYHKLSFSIKDQNGKWSAVETGEFYIKADLKGYQYWFDRQYATAVYTAFPAITENADIGININTGNLLPGRHTVSIRTINEDGKWSSVETNEFYIKPKIVAYQLWFNGDYSTAVTTSITPTYEWIQNVLVTGCAPQEDTVVVFARAKDQMGRWSVVDTTIVPVGVNVSPSVIIAASQNGICTGTSVSLSATPTNGGSTPSYQWKKNGTNVGTNAATYSYTPANGDVITCVLTSSSACASPTTAISNSVTMMVNASVTPGISIAASENDICSGTSVTFTAMPTNGGSTPAYQWKKNGTNVGVNSDTYTYTPDDGDVITCVLTSSATCVSAANATSNAVTMNISSSVTPGISIVASENDICAGSSVTFTATPTNGGSAPAYQWKKNGTNVGTNSATYSYTPANGDIITCVLTSDATCVSTANATSNAVTMNISSSVTPGISIAASQNDICSGSSVIFTAIPTNGGSTPAYQWKKNGTNVGTNSTTYTYTPDDGDVITCVLTSNATCLTTPTAASGGITMTVNTPTTPDVVLTASPGTSVTEGTNVIYTAAVTGADNYMLRWYVDDVWIANTTSPDNTFTHTATTPADTVKAELIVNGCYTDSIFTSNTLIVSVNPTDISKIKEDMGLSIFPNPANDMVYVRTNKGYIQSIGITDVTGRKLMNVIPDNASGMLDINMSSLSPGSYFLQLRIDISDAEYRITEKIILIR